MYIIRYTPASGPNYEGCPCYTYQFGCCPDGKTIAKGPRQQGCSCSDTEFGCCSDGETVADGNGCDCSASKYGCCADGIAEAKGSEFEGCEDKPEDLQGIFLFFIMSLTFIYNKFHHFTIAFKIADLLSEEIALVVFY